MKWNEMRGTTRASLHPSPPRQTMQTRQKRRPRTTKLDTYSEMQNQAVKKKQKTTVRQMICFIANSVNITMIGTVQLYTKTTWSHVKNKQNNVLQTLSNDKIVVKGEKRAPIN